MVALQALSLCPALLASAQETIDYRITTERLHPIDPRLFGQFMERPSWGEIGPEGALVPGTHDLQPEVLRLLREMELTILRFPGGTDVDFMDWRDMVSTVPGRSPERPVSVGHKGHEVTNSFGYDEFLRFNADVGAEAIIVVNFRDGLLEKRPLAEAALDAAALLAYCNAPVGADLPEGMDDWPSVRAANGHPEPFGVHYWQIGNETWAFMDELRKLHPENANERYAECVAAFTEAMLAVDPSIEFIVDADASTLEAGLLAKERIGDKISHLVFHVYSPWSITKVERDGEEVSAYSLSEEEIWNAWVSTPGWHDEGLSVLKHPLLDAAREGGLRVAVTEWNWNGLWRMQPRPLTSSFAKGIGAAGFVHGLMRAGDVIDIGCQSMLVGNSWGIHAVWADREAEMPPHYMSTGQVTAFYSQHHGANRLALESANVPTYSQPYRMAGIWPRDAVAYVDALATGDDRAIYFHAINRHFSREIPVTIDLSAFGPLAGTARHHVLEGRLNDQPKDGEPRQIGRVSATDVTFEGSTLRAVLPARSVSCIEVQL